MVTIQAFSGTWFTAYFLKKLHNDNTNSVLKLNNI